MMGTGAPLTAVLEELRSLLEAEGGPLAAALLRPHDPRALEVFAPLAADGDRTRGDPHAHALVVESIFEGYLLHYGRGRLVDDPDPNLRLLAGDHLYAFGLVQLAEIGDLEAVDELSDLISLCAQVHAASGADAEEATWQLSSALWANAVLAVANGAWPAQREAKRQAREEGAQVIEKVLDAARDRAQVLGLKPRLEHALIAFQQAVEGKLSTAQ